MDDKFISIKTTLLVDICFLIIVSSLGSTWFLTIFRFNYILHPITISIGSKWKLCLCHDICLLWFYINFSWRSPALLFSSLLSGILLINSFEISWSLVSHSSNNLNRLAWYILSSFLSIEGIPSIDTLEQASPNLPTLSYPCKNSLMFR
jgi:hypothetical protein